MLKATPEHSCNPVVKEVSVRCLGRTKIDSLTNSATQTNLWRTDVFIVFLGCKKRREAQESKFLWNVGTCLESWITWQKVVRENGNLWLGCHGTRSYAILTFPSQRDVIRTVSIDEWTTVSSESAVVMCGRRVFREARQSHLARVQTEKQEFQLAWTRRT